MIPHDPRDLEWQRRYEQNDTPWDKGTAAPALVRFLEKNTITGRVLVPGCGRGHEVRALAQQPGCSVVGLDLSPTALAAARSLTAEVGSNSSIKFVEGDFFALALEMNGAFDWLVEHTCFCAIEPHQRADYVRSAFSALSAGGKIFGIFYLNPDTESGPPFAITRQELITLLEPRFVIIEEWVPEVSFPGRENRELALILQRR